MIQDPAAPVSVAPLYVVGAYLALLLVVILGSNRLRRGSSSDYFVASRSIGPFLLLMSVFGTTMTAFTLVGSTGEAFDSGIGVYGVMASTSGIVHSLVFFLVGIKLWAIGKRHGLVTQIQFFRGRFDSNLLGYILFPVLVGLVIPYLLIGLVGAGAVVGGVTRGMFPESFDAGAVPAWLTSLVVCSVVLTYVVAGGVRSAARANAVQTVIFMTVSVLAFLLISSALGGLGTATANVEAVAPELLAREGEIGHLQFLSYALIPVSVGVFPHIFQHWLTAKSARTFRLTVVAHPIFIMIVWLPCVLIGIWAAGIGFEPPEGNPNAVLPAMVGSLLQQPLITGLLTAGILAAIMSSLDSQFVCLGTIFTHDIVMHAAGENRFDERRQVALGRGFIVLVVAVTYGLSLIARPRIFDLAVWCFSGFTSLFPLVLASVYWRRATRAGAIASVVVAAVTWAVIFYEGFIVAPTGEDYLIFGMMPVVVMVVASTLTLVGVSLVTSPPPKAIVDRFFDSPKTAS